VTEAYKCASRDHGSAVVTDPVGQYQFAFTNAFGCNSKWIDGTSEDEAQECAQWQCTNCTVTPGPCF
jgi:hypothetical protein